MKQIYSFLVIAGIIFLRATTLFAQCPDRKLPFMWLPQHESELRAAQFTKAGFLSRSKHGRLSRTIGKNEVTSIWYPIGSFEDLLSTIEKENPGYKNLRVYIASFDNSSNVLIPAGFSQTLMIIFAPANGDPIPKDLHTYYFINQNDGKVYHVSTPDKDKWVAYYNGVKMDALKKSIRKYKDAPENYPGQAHSDATFSDTKSIFYEKKDIDTTFREEVKYQWCHNKVTIDGIQLNFSAFTKNGNLDGIDDDGTLQYDGRYKNRLVVLFEYTVQEGTGHKLFYVDSQADFPNRLKITRDGLAAGNSNTPQALLPKKFTPKFNSDNGQLCPPNCPTE